ncbi:MAG: VWA domain-containing protein [Acidobacteriota bacterium]
MLAANPLRFDRAFAGALALSKRASVALVLVALAAELGAETVEKAPATRPVFEEETSVSWVLVPITVEEIGGDVDVTELTRDDFELRVDERPVAFPDFVTPRDVPRTLLVFQDLSGSMANSGKLQASRTAFRYFLEKARLGDEMALTGFASGKTWVDVPITAERAALLEHVDSWTAYGTTALHDAVAWIPDLRLSARSAPAVLLVTDGIDNSSVISPAAARAMVREAEVPVYVLALVRPRPASRQEEQREWRYRDLLRRLATETGGLYVETPPADVLGACRRIHRALDSRYSLAFPLAEGESTYHSIAVTVNERRVRLRHRSGYTGAPPASAPPLR